VPCSRALAVDIPNVIRTGQQRCVLWLAVVILCVVVGDYSIQNEPSRTAVSGQKSRTTKDQYASDEIGLFASHRRIGPI